jgi:hypothetical protein
MRTGFLIGPNLLRWFLSQNNWTEKRVEGKIEDNIMTKINRDTVRERRRKRDRNAVIIIAVLVVAIIVVLLPPVQSRLAWRLDQARIFIFYSLFPPENAVFVPQEKTPSARTKTVEVTVTPPLEKTTVETKAVSTVVVTPSLTPTITLTPTPLPSYVTALKGVKYFDQHGLWNYCAPANLAMALSYWGWKGDRVDTGKYLKPEELDKNVMPYEIANFVKDKTEYGVVVRYGGTQAILKALLAAKFPVLIEKGMMTREMVTWKVVWMGHYSLVVGYDDLRNVFITRDSYFSPPDYPLDYTVSYEDMAWEWRGFNNVFIVIYDKAQEDTLKSVLGAYSDEAQSIKIAQQTAQDETQTLKDKDLFFAWFNLGTNQTMQKDYEKAAEAYDKAFSIYATLPKDQRPFRVMWYEVGPYEAYYQVERYQDVIDLASTTINAADKPYLEESFYWRAKAKAALGDKAGALQDINISLQYHPGYSFSEAFLKELNGN